MATKTEKLEADLASAKAKQATLDDLLNQTKPELDAAVENLSKRLGELSPEQRRDLYHLLHSYGMAD
jgi:ABC-type transporter Mla subunit MlaD